MAHIFSSDTAVKILEMYLLTDILQFSNFWNECTMKVVMSRLFPKALSLSEQKWLKSREYWMIYRGPYDLAPHPPLKGSSLPSVSWTGETQEG